MIHSYLFWTYYDVESGDDDDGDDENERFLPFQLLLLAL